MNAEGSSPRVRGKLLQFVYTMRFLGLIPACAGKTATGNAYIKVERAHPRVCGENTIWAAPLVPKTGSSPRVRGKLDELQSRISDAGLIPACAGKTTASQSRESESQAHPRVCGENSAIWFLRFRSPGSSPRVRGKPVFPSRQPDNERLIPACAGKTNTVGTVSASGRAHPRVCGENLDWFVMALQLGGSSPRVRGKRFSQRILRPRVGLIPACAGKTRASSNTNHPTGAHPRVCGENQDPFAFVVHAWGSSPRVRGKLVSLLLIVVRLGLIPACAGKTQVQPQQNPQTGAHPRVCGENMIVHYTRSRVCGSSPRVRGKR